MLCLLAMDVVVVGGGVGVGVEFGRACIRIGKSDGECRPVPSCARD